MPVAPVRNGEIYFEETGAGEPIILLPGLGHDHTYYAKTVPPLSKLGRGFIETDEGRAAVERLFSSVSRNSPQKYRAFIQAILRFGRLEPDQEGEPRLTVRLGEIRVPTRIIVGGHDILTPVSVSQKMAARIPGAELRVIPECGHITFTERPTETVAFIEEFLRTVIAH